jgi:hypothetical protein
MARVTADRPAGPSGLHRGTGHRQRRRGPGPRRHPGSVPARVAARGPRPRRDGVRRRAPCPAPPRRLTTLPLPQRGSSRARVSAAHPAPRAPWPWRSRRRSLRAGRRGSGRGPRPSLRARAACSRAARRSSGVPGGGTGGGSSASVRPGWGPYAICRSRGGTAALAATLVNGRLKDLEKVGTRPGRFARCRG